MGNIENNFDAIMREINENRIRDLQDMADGVYESMKPTPQDLYWREVPKRGDGRFGDGHPD